MSSTASVMWCRPGPRRSRYLRNRRVAARRLEQLQRRSARGDEVRSHPLRRHLLGRLDRQPERVAIERERLIQVGDGDADVIERRRRLAAGDGARDDAVGRRVGVELRAAIRSSVASNSPGSSTDDSTWRTKRCDSSSRSRYSARARRRPARAARCGRETARPPPAARRRPCRSSLPS